VLYSTVTFVRGRTLQCLAVRSQNPSYSNGRSHCKAACSFLLHCTALHCTTLHCTALHCKAVCSFLLHCALTLHSTPVCDLAALHYTALHCTALHCTPVCEVTWPGPRVTLHHQPPSSLAMDLLLLHCCMDLHYCTTLLQHCTTLLTSLHCTLH
jgi:hypothetical protein